MYTLIVKSISGFVFLMLALALSLFLPAGTFRYWQAWVYLGVFSICTILITAYLMRYDRKLLTSRVKAGPVAETQKSQQIIQSLASICFLLLFVLSALDFRLHWSEVPPVLSLISDLFVALGFFVVFLVFRENSYASATIQVSPEQRVIASGPYRVVRHPMYAGAIVLTLFTPPALGSWAALPCPLALLAVIVVRLMEEEKFLSANLRGYVEYRRRVRYRLVPFIW